MFSVENDGRMFKIKPLFEGTWEKENDWLVMERVTALRLAQQIQYARDFPEDPEQEPEDG
jgi:hypothetical protein